MKPCPLGAIAVGTDGVVRFTHPLLGAAVYFGVPPGRRREVHRQAAALVEELEQQARHLALATASPDEEIASVVERAAYAAAERGAPGRRRGARGRGRKAHAT